MSKRPSSVGVAKLLESCSCSNQLSSVKKRTDTDHRQLCSPHADGARSFFVADSDSREDFEAAVATLRGDDGWGRRMVEVRQGRQLAVERAAGGVCRFGFGELCEADVGAADFGVRTHATLRFHRARLSAKVD